MDKSSLEEELQEGTWPGDPPDAMTPYQAEQVLLCCGKDFDGSHLKQQVERALGAATVTNVVQNYLTALRHGLGTGLTRPLLDFIRDRFTEVSQTKGFLNLLPEVITVILRDSHLRVDTELDVYVAALSWLEYNKQQRLKYAAEVLRCVRFSYLSPADVVKYVEPNQALFAGEGNGILTSIYRTHMLLLAGLQDKIAEPPRNYQTHADFIGQKSVYFKPDTKLDVMVENLHDSFKDAPGSNAETVSFAKGGQNERFHFRLKDRNNTLKSEVTPSFSERNCVSFSNRSARQLNKDIHVEGNIKDTGKDGISQNDCQFRRGILKNKSTSLPMSYLKPNESYIRDKINASRNSYASHPIDTLHFSKRTSDVPTNSSITDIRKQVEASWSLQDDPITFNRQKLETNNKVNKTASAYSGQNRASEKKYEKLYAKFSILISRRKHVHKE